MPTYDIPDMLIYDRNVDMANVITEYIHDNKVFFVVIGAGHYVGKDSVIEILEKTKKYKIIRF